MRELHAHIREIADELQTSSGELLRLAREISHNAGLPSLDLMTAGQALEMILTLQRARLSRRLKAA